jgi:uncharacterized membrane protein SpoIIM required for sporulation
VDERSFVEGSRPTWDRLAAAVGDARSEGVATLGVTRLKQMHEDYRQTAADLAYAQTHFAGSRTAVYLNRLVGQAHGELYGAAPRRGAALWRFLSRGYPRMVRRNARPMLLAAGVLFGAVALGFLLARIDYPLARLFLPAEYRDVAGDALAQGQPVRDLLAPLAPLLTAGITVNNVQVAILAFAGGITFGLMTAWSLFQNGMLLGVLTGMFTNSGESLQFLALIVPHGSLELPAIALAGGAGLMLAKAILAPGDLPRLDALRAVAPEAVRILLGTVPLFIVAGFVEGFVTPRGYAPPLKIALGVALFTGLAAYLTLGGRGADDAA